MMDNKCQLYSLFVDKDKLGIFEVISLRTHQLFTRTIKRRKNYLINWFRNFIQKFSRKSNINEVKAETQELKAGDMVRVKSKEEIQATLNNWNRTGKCAFMEEQLQYCGTIQRVKKPVRRFVDETDWLPKKTKHNYILENLNCEGSIDFGKCDRCCFFMWRIEWLEKVEKQD